MTFQFFMDLTYVLGVLWMALGVWRLGTHLDTTRLVIQGLRYHVMGIKDVLEDMLQQESISLELVSEDEDAKR